MPLTYFLKLSMLPTTLQIIVDDSDADLFFFHLCKVDAVILVHMTVDSNLSFN